jgi:hypothetical protein
MTKTMLSPTALAQETASFMRGLYKHTYNRVEAQRFDIIKLIKTFIKHLSDEHEFEFPLTDLCEEKNQITFARALNNLFYNVVTNPSEEVRELHAEFLNFIVTDLGNYAKSVDDRLNQDLYNFDKILKTHQEQSKLDPKSDSK